MILLTGASGFIGSALRIKLESSHFTCATLTSSDTKFNPEFEEIGHKVTCIVVCGGFVAHSNAEAQDLIGAQKSDQLMAFLFSKEFPNLKKIIYLSTCDVYSQSGEIDEASNIEGSNLYTITKIKQELYVQRFATDRNITFVILRLGNVFGPGEFRFNKIIPRAIECALSNQALVLSITRQSKIQPIYINDVTNSIMQLVQQCETSMMLNLVGESPITVEDLIFEISKYANLKVVEGRQVSDYTRIYNAKKMLEIFRIPFTKFPEGIMEEFNFEKKRLNFR